MRFNLKVPYAEKDQAKKLGARWDAARKLWYVAGKDGAAPDLAPLARWSPSAHDEALGAPGAAVPAVPPAGSGGGGGRQAASQLFVGSRYVAVARVCDCAPWEECERCRVHALAVR